MTRIFTLAAVLLACVFACGLHAQLGKNYKKQQGSYKKASDKANKAGAAQAKKGQKAAEKEEREEEREAGKEGEKEGEAEDGIAIEGGDGADEVVEPGTTTTKAEKDAAIDEVMDELKLEDKSKRSKFKTSVRGAWDDSETEDQRYAIVYKRHIANAEQLEAEKRVHADKLKKIWDESDAKLAKDEVLTEAQNEKWKELSKDLRTKTSTDWYYEEQAKAAEPRKEKKQRKEGEGKETEEGTEEGKD